MNILVSIPKGPIRDTFIPSEVASILESVGKVIWNEKNENYASKELREHLQGIDVCITGWGNACFDAYVLEGADKLKLVAHTGGSVAAYVNDTFFSKGLTIISGNRIYAESVAEGVIAYMLCSLRELPHYSNEIQEGHWSKPDSYYEGLLDKEVGLVGFGMVARYLSRMLKTFRAKIKVYDSCVSDAVMSEYSVQRASIEEVMSSCKIISLHVPGTPSTYHMINAELLHMIQAGALLINTSRGSVIDEKALSEELAKSRFKAVLDVFEEEPLPKESKLRGLKNVILIPHMAGPTFDRRKLVTLALIDDIKNYSMGSQLKHVIDRQYAMSMSQ